MAWGGGDQRRIIRDFIISGVQWIASSIVRPAVDVYNFELKPTLISMVQQSQFGKTPLEDSNLHLLIFLKVYDILKLNGVSSDVIRMYLFPFSLRDKARAWLHSLPSRCITTWDELTKAFLDKLSLRAKPQAWEIRSPTSCKKMKRSSMKPESG